MRIGCAQMFLLFSLPLSTKASITTSHFTLYKIKALEQGQSQKTSNKESIAECGASCIFDLCNVFLFDKASLLCTTTNLEKVELDSQGIQAYVNDLTKPVAACSETHPFAYQDGDRCCATRVAGVEENLWSPLEIFLSLRSSTCFGDSDVACPAETGDCLNYDVNNTEGCEVSGLRFKPTSLDPFDVIEGMGGTCGATDMEPRIEVPMGDTYLCKMRCLVTVGCVGFNLNGADCVLKEGALDLDTCDTPFPGWDMYKLLVTKSILDDLTLKADKRIVVDDTSKQSRAQVVDAAECVQKCQDSPGCIALTVTTNWAQNSCVMFTEVTRVEDDTSSAKRFSKVLGCDSGLDFQVPCYLLEQEAKLTGPATDQYYGNYWVADNTITDANGCRTKCVETTIPNKGKCAAYTFKQGGGYKSCSLMFGDIEVDSAEDNVWSGLKTCPH